MNGLRKMFCFVTACFSGVRVARHRCHAEQALPARHGGRIAEQRATGQRRHGDDHQRDPSGASAQIGSFRVSVANVSGITIVGATAAERVPRVSAAS